MKNLIYLSFLFLFIGSSFAYKNTVCHHFSSIADNPLAIEVKIDQPTTATSSDGTLQLSISGGTSPYTIQIISTFSPSQVYKEQRIQLKKLGVGNYTIIVQDAERHALQKIIELTPVQ
ncbi:MAG: hypothetical protein JWO58_947 [Chitinophagaceae bacterium]|nr:hypothetical protein [Chitinophagaceae bacterium]